MLLEQQQLCKLIGMNHLVELVYLNLVVVQRLVEHIQLHLNHLGNHLFHHIGMIVEHIVGHHGIEILLADKYLLVYVHHNFVHQNYHRNHHHLKNDCGFRILNKNKYYHHKATFFECIDHCHI